MTRFLLLIPFLFFACTGQEKPESSEEIFQSVNQEVLKNSAGYMRLKEATETIGHRLTGSENGAKAEQYIYDQLKAFGFEDVRFDEFEVNAWSRGEVTTTLLPDQRIRSVSLGHSPVSADVTAEVVDMGSGLLSDFENIGDSLQGKFALMYIGVLEDAPEGARNLHRSEKAELAIRHGAAGVIIYNRYPEVLLTGTASVTGEMLPVPAVCITLEAGNMLREKIQTSPDEVHVRISMTNHSGPIKARNVIATLPGAELPDERVIVGGHLDSWDLATGAIDNGIGSFAVLDIARTFKANNLRPRRTVQFAFFMGEEQGLLGSTHMVEQEEAKGTIDQIKFMMNLDMSGNPIGMNVSGAAVDTVFFHSLGKQIHGIDTVFKGNFSSRAGLHSDHQPFMLAGVPILSVHSNLERKIYECYHADCDSFGLVNKEHMQNTARFGTMMLFAIADADKLPAVKMNSEETRQYMVENGLEENLRMQGDWKWGE